MTHPYRETVKSEHQERMARFHRATGGHVPEGEEKTKSLIRKAISEHDQHMHGTTKKEALKLEHGGAAKHRLDKHRNKHRESHKDGGKAGKKGTQVNVIIAGHGNAPAAPAASAAMPPRPMPPGAGMAPGAAPPPGAVPPQALAALLGGAHKRGGRTSRAKGGGVFTAGSGTGEGRLQKAAKAKK